eukprot:158337-Pyramimonas_sp.AAC.1
MAVTIRGRTAPASKGNFAIAGSPTRVTPVAPEASIPRNLMRKASGKGNYRQRGGKRGLTRWSSSALGKLSQCRRSHIADVFAQECDNCPGTLYPGNCLLYTSPSPRDRSLS